jgi:putative DNA primase/helicase
MTPHDSYEDDVFKPQYTLLTGSEVEALPGTEWLVKGLLPTQGIAAIYGASGSGKTFLCLDLALAIAGDDSWFGHRIPRNVPVVYCPLEAERGIRRRLQARRLHRGAIVTPGTFRVLQGSPVTLGEPEDMAALGAAIVATLGTGAVTIIDTLNRAMSGDENSGADMGIALDGAHQLQHLTGGLVILVHHTGKDAGRGMRGHSSLFASQDAVIEVLFDKGVRQLRLTKSKDGESGASFGFKLSAIPLGSDADGDMVSSCAVEWDKAASPQIKAAVREPTGANQRLALSTIKVELLGDKVVEKDGRLVLPYQVALDAVVLGLIEEVSVEPARARERAKQALNSLRDGNFIQHCGNPLRIADRFIWA